MRKAMRYQSIPKSNQPVRDDIDAPEPWVRMLNGKRGLHLVVLYIVVGNRRIPWSFRVWRGKGQPILTLAFTWFNSAKDVGRLRASLRPLSISLACIALVRALKSVSIAGSFSRLFPTYSLIGLTFGLGHLF